MLGQGRGKRKEKPPRFLPPSLTLSWSPFLLFRPEKELLLELFLFTPGVYFQVSESFKSRPGDTRKGENGHLPISSLVDLHTLVFSICLLPFTFLCSQIAAPFILSKIYTCIKKHRRVCLSIFPRTGIQAQLCLICETRKEMWMLSKYKFKAYLQSLYYELLKNYALIWFPGSFCLLLLFF